MNRIRLCPSGKIAYARKEEAKVVIRRARELPEQYHSQGKIPKTYYRCAECGFFHVTSFIGTLAAGNRKPT